MRIICNKIGDGGKQCDTCNKTEIIIAFHKLLKTEHSLNYSLHQIAEPCSEGEIYCIPHTWKGKEY